MSMAVRRVLIGIIRYFYKVFRKRRGRERKPFLSSVNVLLSVCIAVLLAIPSRNIGLAAKGMNKLVFITSYH